MRDEDDAIAYRAAGPADRAFVLSSWKAARQHDPEFWGIDVQTYHDGMRRRLEALLQRADTQLVIACDRISAVTIFGYAVSAPDVLHWVYVKSSMRRCGLAKALVAKSLGRSSDFAVTTSFAPILPGATAAGEAKRRDRRVFGDLCAKYKMHYDPFAADAMCIAVLEARRTA